MPMSVLTICNQTVTIKLYCFEMGTFNSGHSVTQNCTVNVTFILVGEDVAC
jgi:hypothetical protein